MFQNVGGKIKSFALINFWVDAAAAIIGGLAMMIEDIDMILISILVAAAGCFVAWVVSLFLYGFGELIETNQKIAYKLGGDELMYPEVATPGEMPTAQTGYAAYNASAYNANAQVVGAQPVQTAYATPESNVNRWRCDNCGGMIDSEICPFCGKAYGTAAQKIESLDRLLKNGTITPMEYQKKLEEIKKS